jgi:hypothetical protein
MRPIVRFRSEQHTVHFPEVHGATNVPLIGCCGLCHCPILHCPMFCILARLSIHFARSVAWMSSGLTKRLRAGHQREAPGVPPQAFEPWRDSRAVERSGWSVRPHAYQATLKLVRFRQLAGVSRRHTTICWIVDRVRRLDVGLNGRTNGRSPVRPTLTALVLPPMLGFQNRVRPRESTVCIGSKSEHHEEYSEHLRRQ